MPNRCPMNRYVPAPAPETGMAAAPLKRRELLGGLAGVAAGLMLTRRLGGAGGAGVSAADVQGGPDLQGRRVPPSELRLPPEHPALAWWREARFGMFIHWGLPSLGGGGDAALGDVGGEGFKRRMAAFTAPAFDADAWAQLAVDAGARYLVLVCRHADGFCLWPSEQTEFTVARTPLAVDVAGQLAAACGRRGVRFGCYLALPDLRHPDWPRGLGRDGASKRNADPERFLAYLQAQTRELVERYAPSILWFDGDNEAPWTHAHGLALYRWCRSLDPQLLVNDRVDKGRQGLKIGDGKRPEDFGYKPGDDVELFTYFRTPRPPGEYAGDFATPEQVIGAFDRTKPWETCMTLGTNWFWKENEVLKTTEALVGVLARCAGADGNFLLNLAPRGDGGVDRVQAERMRGFGDLVGEERIRRLRHAGRPLDARTLRREHLLGFAGAPHRP
jgi:alpha-L-fucosidase